MPYVAVAVQYSTEKHALDPSNKNIIPLEPALVPYQPPEMDNSSTVQF